MPGKRKYFNRRNYPLIGQDKPSSPAPLDINLIRPKGSDDLVIRLSHRVTNIRLTLPQAEALVDMLKRGIAAVKDKPNADEEE